MPSNSCPELTAVPVVVVVVLLQSDSKPMLLLSDPLTSEELEDAEAPPAA
jgi:hypothetical protein